VTAVLARATGPVDRVVTWGRCLRLLGAGPAAWCIILVISLSSIASAVWGVYALLVVLAWGLFAEVRNVTAANRLAYLQGLPVRASSRTLLLLPEVLFSGLAIAGAARWSHAFGPLHALTLWGCCAWAIATSHFFPIRRVLRFPLWLAIAGLAPFVSLCAYGPGDGADGWRRAAAAAVVMGALGFVLGPRSLRRRVTRPTSQVPRTPLAAAANIPRFRPANRRVGLAKLWRLSMPNQSTWVLAAWALVVLISSALFWAAREWQQETLITMAWPMAFGGFIATATSRRVTEFLWTRPLARAHLLAAMVVPWILMAFVPALLAFARERSAVPAPGMGAHEISARLALTTLALLFFSGTEPARGSRLDPVAGVASLVVSTGLVFWTAAWTASVTSPRHSIPAPPTWALVAGAVAGAAYWYRRALRRVLALG
jgi:hypothetical protein